MAFSLSMFDTLAVPTILGPSGSFDFILSERRSPLIATPGGSYDPLGTDWARRGASTLTADVVLVETTAVALQTALDAWTAKLGKIGTLTRKDSAGNLQTLSARLIDVTAKRTTENYLFLPISLTFETTAQVWNGAAHDLWTTVLTTNSTISVPNGGNARVSNIFVAVVAHGVSVTLVRLVLAGFGIDLVWVGTVPAGANLQIDTGALKVTNTGGGAGYSGFTLNPAHTVDDWLRLEPGANSLSVSIWLDGTWGAGHYPEVQISFQDGWS
jgi:hypothetical protein